MKMNEDKPALFGPAVIEWSRQKSKSSPSSDLRFL